MKKKHFMEVQSFQTNYLSLIFYLYICLLFDEWFSIACECVNTFNWLCLGTSRNIFSMFDFFIQQNLEQDQNIFNKILYFNLELFAFRSQVIWNGHQDIKIILIPFLVVENSLVACMFSDLTN